VTARFGATAQGDGTTRFALWAPDADSVSVETQNGRQYKMQRRHDGIFDGVFPLSAGNFYKYRISPELVVPDPASHGQAGGVHGWSVVVDPVFEWQAISWRGRPWHETVIYELHPGAMGGFAGIEAELARLAGLGVTAIQLMPIADFPGAHNWGYDGVLLFAPAAAYGTVLELKHLIDAAHGLGVQVFLDVVYNHFGPDGNYLSAYASAFFKPDQQTPWGRAIDFSQGHVKEFFIANALYWLNDFRFDGLRFDAVHAIDDNEFLLNLADAIRDGVAGRDVHLILENENNDAQLLQRGAEHSGFDAQWADDWHHAAHVLLTGDSEGYYQDFQDAAAMLARCLAE